jgi:VanZ family protein
MTDRELKRLRLWLFAGWLAVAVVAVLSLVPLPDFAAVPRGGDKIEHLLTYFVLMLWFAQLSADHATLARRAFALIALGGVIELLQALTPYRSAEWLDFGADALGVLCGFALGRGPAGRWLERSGG